MHWGPGFVPQNRGGKMAARKGEYKWEMQTKKKRKRKRKKGAGYSIG
jgi:hypothetical protein